MISEDSMEEDIAGEASHARRILAILELNDLLNAVGDEDASEADS